MKKTHYRPDKELILTSNQNTLSNSITRDIKKKDYDSIREIVEDKQEIIYKTIKKIKLRKYYRRQMLIGRYYLLKIRIILIKRNIKIILSILKYIIMDNIVAEANDVMSPALDFGLPKTAQYVQDRWHVNYFPPGSNIYTSATGNKNIRFYITGEDGTYLDLSSIRMFANL